MTDVQPTPADADESRADGPETEAEVLEGTAVEDASTPAGENADDEVLHEEVGLLDAMGGRRAIFDAGLAGGVYSIVFTLDGAKLGPALIAALSTALILMIVSLIQKRPIRQSISSFVGILIMALIARSSGQARNFYLFPIIKNFAYAIAYLVTILIKWPLLGILFGPINGEGMAWQKDPARRRSYSLASWVWFGVFALRLVVQVPQYIAHSILGLGISSILLGTPPFLLACWWSFDILARTKPVRPTSGFWSLMRDI